MKRTLACCLALTLLSIPMQVFAAEEITPAEMDEAAYAYLLAHSSYTFDPDKDGVITEAELRAVGYMSLDLTDVQDISWMTKPENCIQISLEGGNLTDFSVLTDLPKLIALDLDNVPLTDISFIKDMQLESCRLENMEQITTQQRIDVMQWDDLTVVSGTEGRITMSPYGLVDTVITIADDNTAVFLGGAESSTQINPRVYGVSSGETTYTVSVDGTDYLTRKLAVTEAPQPYDPALHQTAITNYRVEQSKYYNLNPETLDAGTVALINGTLYSFSGSNVQIAETEVADYNFFYSRSYSGSYNYADIVLKTDGSMLVNGKQLLETPVSAIWDGYALTESGCIYAIVPKGDDFTAILITNNVERLVENCPMLYVSTSGLLMYYGYRLTGDGTIRAYANHTNAGVPVMAEAIGKRYYTVDVRHELYLLDLTDSYDKKKIDSDVTDLYFTVDESGSSLNYTKSDGTVTTITTLTYGSVYGTGYWPGMELEVGTFYIHEYQSQGVSEDDAVITYYIDCDRKVSLRFLDTYCALTNVESAICSTYDSAAQNSLLYFLREDGSIWQYNLDTQVWQEMTVLKEVEGDINGDDIFSVSDVVCLQRWLLHDGTVPANWRAGDYNKDGKLTAVDLTMMKRALL